MVNNNNSCRYTKPNNILIEIIRDVNDKSVGPIRLQYASGPSQALAINGLIADNVTASIGSYKWKIPSDIKSKK